MKNKKVEMPAPPPLDLAVLFPDDGKDLVLPDSKYFKTLKYYTYGFVSRNPEAEDYKNYSYIGKGKGGRCLNHCNENHKDYKGVNYEDLVIIETGYETEDEAYAQEMLLEAIYNPRLNKVSGHHKKDKYIMKSLNELFTSELSARRSLNFEAMAMLNKIDELYGEKTIGNIKISQSSWVINTSTKDQKIFYIESSIKEPCYTASISDKSTKYKGTLSMIKKMVGKENVTEAKAESVKKMTWEIKDEEEALALWGQFV